MSHIAPRTDESIDSILRGALWLIDTQMVTSRCSLNLNFALIRYEINQTLIFVVATRYIICAVSYVSWWRHLMETFSALLVLCEAVDSPLTKASDAELWFFFDRRLNKWLGTQSRRRLFETPLCSCRHCNVLCYLRSSRHWHWSGRKCV